MEKYVACHVKYHIILANLMEYGYQGLDPGWKVGYLLSGIRCDELSMAVAAVRTHPDRYDTDFGTILALLSQYIDKKTPTLSVKVLSVTETSPVKRLKTSAHRCTFREKIELKKYYREEYDSISALQRQQLYELQKRARLIRGKKTPEGKRGSEARVAMMEAKSENSSNESLFADVKLTASDRNNQAFDRKGNSTRHSQSYADASQLGSSKRESKPSVLRNSYIKPLSTIKVTVAQGSVASSKPKIE